MISESINIEYLKEITEYQELPVKPCSYQQAKRLLKRFHNREFFSFWEDPVGEFFPAVSAGVMKLSVNPLSHQEALKYGKKLIEKLSVKQLL